MTFTKYPEDIEQSMRLLFASLSERDRRRSAADEAAKLGPGGTTYLAHLFGCSERVPTRGWS